MCMHDCASKFVWLNTYVSSFNGPAAGCEISEPFNAYIRMYVHMYIHVLYVVQWSAHVTQNVKSA